MNLRGRTLDVYALGAELGRGGMGTVYRAETREDGEAGPKGTAVAVKIFHGHLVAEEDTFQRFVREAEIGRRVRHPNVVRTYAIGRAEVDGEPVHYMVMELIEGRTLAQLRAELGTFPEHLLYQVADQVLAGLDAIHELGIIHRDIKPENIVITAAHKVLLMDLGVARLVEQGQTLTEKGVFVGSLAYAAPEQFLGVERLGPACDLYGFGVVLFELATGVVPYDAADLGALLNAKLQGEPKRARGVRPDLDPFLDEVVATCLAREPQRRFPSARALRDVLRDGVQGEWWHARAGKDALPGAERALRRLRMERETPLVGRAEELARLRGAYDAARGGRGRVVAVAGAAGIGKSRLVYQFLEGLADADGPLALAGRCLGPGDRAYQPFLEAAADLFALDEIPSGQRLDRLREELARLLPDAPRAAHGLADFLLSGMSPAESSGFSKDALVSSLTTVFRGAASERPIVLVLEDLHLAGAETVELAGYFARCIAESPVLLVAVLEDDEEAAAPLAALPGAERLQLQPLSLDQTRELVRALVGHESTANALGALLHEKADGNPHLVLEMVAHLRESGALEERDGRLVATGEIEVAAPSELLERRLARLDEEQRQTLEAAAVLGMSFEASLLAAVLEERRIQLLQRLAVLERKHRLVRSAGRDSFTFAKHQVRDALYGGLSPALRDAYHSMAADAILQRLEGADAEGETAHALVRHMLAAERADEIAPHVDAAAQHVVRHYHPAQALAFLRRVAGAVSEPAAAFRVAMLQWSCADALGSRDDQLAVLERARELASTDPRRSAQLHCLLGVTAWRTGDYERAGEEAERGLALAVEAGDREWEANSRHTLGAVARQRGDYARCAALWEKALAIRREIGDRGGEARSLASLGTVAQELGESERALVRKREALSIFRELGDRRGEGALLNNIASSLLAQQRIDDGVASLERAAEIAREIGDLVAEGHPLCNLGRAYTMVGRVDRARQCLTRALAIFTEARLRNGRLDALNALAQAHLTFGDLEAARVRLEEARDLAAETGAKPMELECERNLGTVLHRLDRHAEAWPRFQRALELADELANPRQRTAIALAMGEAALNEAAFDRAVEVLDAALATAHDVPLEKGETLLARSRLALAHHHAGRREDALAWAALAEDSLSAGDGTGEAAVEALYALRAVHGDTERGRAFLARARDIVETRSARIADRAYREYYRTRSWPAAGILDDARRTLAEPG